MANVITSVNQLDFTLSDLDSYPLPTRAFMVEPTHFTVEYIINPHMAGNIGKIDKEKAWDEWRAIRDTFLSLDLAVHEIEGQEGLPDMVFCANQSLPFLDEDGDKQAIMSIMHADQRKEEVPYIEQWYRQNGYEINYLDEDKVEDFEGMGDAIWHTGKKLLWGGYGFRSSVEAYEEVAELTGAPVVALELVSDEFYHLDTCLCMLNKESALVYKKAFTDEGLKLIDALFENVIEADEEEALKLFACNATCPDGKNVLIQKGCDTTNDKLVDAGFLVHQLETGEFLKSGGSVFCMKMLLW